MTDRDNYQKVGVEVDEQSFAKLTQKTNDTANTLTHLAQVNQSVANTAAQISGSYEGSWAKATQTIKGHEQAIQSADDRIKQYMADIAKTAELDKLVADPFGDGSGAPQNNGGGFSGVSGLRRTGSALTQLGLGDVGRPVQIAGDIQQVTKEFSQIGDVTKTLIPALAGVDAGLVGTLTVLAPIGAAVAVIAAIGAVWNNELEEGKKKQQEAVSGIEAYYKAIEDGTSATIAAAKLKAQQELDIAQKTLDAEKAARDKAFQEQSNTNFGLGDFGARVRTAFGALNTYNDAIDAQAKKIPQLQGTVDGLTTAYNDQAVKANDAAEAVLKAADATTASQIEQYKLLRTGTVKQIQGIIDDNKDTVQAYTAELSNLQKIKNPSADTQKRIEELTQKITDLSNQSLALTQNVLPLVKAREDETNALKELNTATQAAQKARDEMAQKEVDSVKKYNDAVQQANDTADQSRLAAAEKLNTALVNAAQAAVDAASKALETLQQKQADNLTSLDRDLSKLDRENADKQLTDQIAAQKQERDDLQAHLTALQQIRDRDKGRERDDQLNRNYRDLFALKEQQNQDIGTENDKYAKQEAARQEAFKSQENDQSRALEIQRRERLIAYQQANQDAVKAYNIELQHAQEAKTRAIQVAQQGYAKELDLIYKTQVNKLSELQKSAVAELKIITQTEQAKQKIFQTSLDQARQMLGQQTAAQSAPFNSPQRISQDTGYADGGGVGAYQRVKVNDLNGGQRESFNGALLPRGLGLFIPMTSGRIDAGGGASKTFSPTYNITGPDPRTIADMIDARNRRMVKEVFDK